MKKFTWFLLILVAILSAIVLYLSVPKNKKLGANYFSLATVSATSTTSALPAKVLDVNSNRNYALIQNDSDTAIYLYLGYFADQSAASTSVGVNKGIRLLPNAANSFEIDSDNLYTGQVWASSTAASKKIIYIEN